ncbi:MAG TPA: S9 family peptidase [Opitutaceae bacterium]|nr:S9 family peptidase [Opitutaceae bacterium]
MRGYIISIRLTLGTALCLGALFASSAVRGATPPTATIPTIEELFRPHFLGKAQLSPDGKFMAAISADENNKRHLRLIDLAGGKVSDLAGFSGYDIYSFRWLGNGRILYSVSQSEFYALGLFVADVSDLQSAHPIDLNDAVEVIGNSRSQPNHLLVWIVQSSENDGADGGLVEIDAARSEVSNFQQIQLGDSVLRTYPAPPSGTVVDWKSDFDGELAFCYTYEKGHFHLFRYQSAQSTWQKVSLNLDGFAGPTLDPDGRHLWVTRHDSKNGFVLQEYDLDSGQFENPVFQDQAYDLAEGRLIFSHKSRQLVGFTYEQRHEHNLWLDKQFAAVQASVDENFPHCDNELVDFDDNEKRFLFRVTSDQQPGLYVLFDLEQNTLFRVTEAAPWLDGKALATTQPISFRTRDGVKLEGYLTLPPGASKKDPPPLVVLPHGGPWVRDTWGFDPEVQFLASRGYAVLQPNYRGSSGYSPQISEDKKFDFRRMHDDVTDATHAMQRSGLIDPTRIAIMGGSFGGYLSLTGVAFEPGLYRCAISLAGVFDWEEQIKEKKWNDQTAAYKYLSDHIGQPGTNRAHFDEISPINHVAQIHVPVFIAHGTDDTTVSVHQSRRMVSELEKNGVPHETFYRGWEGHGFTHYEDQVEYYHRVEAFLAKYLEPKSADSPPTAAK